MTDLATQLGCARFIPPMRAIYLERQTGVLVIEGPNLKKRLYFVDGELHLLRTDLALIEKISAWLDEDRRSTNSGGSPRSTDGGNGQRAGDEAVSADLRALAQMIGQHWTAWNATSCRFIPRLDRSRAELVGPLPTVHLLAMAESRGPTSCRGGPGPVARGRRAAEASALVSSGDSRVPGRDTEQPRTDPVDGQARLIWQEHFGLSGDPFSLTPDPAFLFLSEGHSEALAALEVGLLERRGLTVLTGEVGTGKTTLLYSLLSDVGSEVETAFIANTTLSFDEILQAALNDLGAEPVSSRRIDLLESLNQLLLESNEQNRTVALVVDEAHELSVEAFEGIRQLLNFETYDRKLLQIFLVGQPELGARLARRELRQVADRIAVRCHLEPLKPEEARRYIAHRLEAAGAVDPIFTRRAIDLIIRESRRIPRSINVLCHNAMLFAFAKQEAAVTRSEAWEAVRERRGPRPGVFWSGRRLAAGILAGSILILVGALSWLGLTGSKGKLASEPPLPSAAGAPPESTLQAPREPEPAPPQPEPAPPEPPAEPLAEKPFRVKVTTANLNLRQGPSLDHEIITTLPLGTEIILLSDEGEWAIVRSDDRSGWVYSSYLAEVKGSDTAGGIS